MTNSRKVLFCDLDDTLIYTAGIFEERKKNNAEIIARDLGISAEQVYQFIGQVEMEMIKLFGVNCHRFSYSCRFAYQALCRRLGRSPKEEVWRRIWKEAEEVYTNDFKTIEGSTDALRQAKALGWDIVIWTLGDWWGQLRKVLNLEVDDVLYDIQTLPVKDDQSLAKGLEMYPADIAVMVGNSQRSDVYPALKCGIWAVHIPAETWAYDEFPIDTTHEKYVVIDSITQLPSALKHIERVEIEKSVLVGERAS